jgi:phasin
MKGNIVEANTKQTNINPKAADENARSGFPFLAVPPVFDGLAEQNMTRAREGIEKVKSAAGAINEAVRDACSNNARCAAEYSAKVIEFSGVNTDATLDFLAQLVSVKSPSEAVQLSITQGRKSFEATTSQNRELWELARKVATETAAPLKKGFASTLPKAA